ncbi:nucleolar protein 9 [Halyomorpha halys]|uniref:nucleolar protein 9 n=1 Tax=Halyomorpha halys TaxID=286706 RepID=UPI0006D4FE37|nr:nucleolar protein 9 [Halyomorpha halys]
MDTKSRKRKKKKSVLGQARKYGRKGYYGRGTHVEEDIYQYFLKIYEMKMEEFETEEEKVTFANNALKQTEDQEVHLSSNQFVSRVIEKLLPFSNDDNLFKFISSFSDLRILSTDSYASHVLQTLIKVCAAKFREKGQSTEESKYCEYVKRVSLFIFNNLEEFMEDPYANQIGRCCLEECSGNESNKPLSPETVDNLALRILNWPTFNFATSSELASGFMQILLASVAKTNPKLAQKIVKRLFTECFVSEDVKLENTDVEKMFNSMASTRILESMVEVSTGKRYTQILSILFLGRLTLLSCNKNSFICVQKLISSCQDLSELKLINSELIPHFEEIMSAGHVGVLLELAKACIRLKSNEGEFLKGLKEALKAEHSSCGELVLKLLFPSGDSVNKNGSLLLQTLFQFKKPISVVENLLSVDTKKLKEIFLDPKGSYIMDAYVSSKTIGEKSRDRIIHKFKGHYKDLAQDKFGSRAVEALWSRASIKEKHLIMSELDRSICRTMAGSIIASKFRLDLYLSDKAKWASTETKSAVKIFSNIVA